MNNKRNENIGIFKSTILFSLVKVITLFSRIVINKVVSVLLGSAGIGIISLFYSSTDLIKTIFSLGIPQSVVRDVALVDPEVDFIKFSKIVRVSKRVVIFTGCLGAVFTILMSPYLSYYTFGNYNYTLSFVFLSLFVFSNIVNDGQIAILRGLRNLKALAKSTLFGALLALALDIPIYYFLGERGILPSLLIAAFSSLLFSWSLISKVKHKKVKLSLEETYKGSLDMIRLGLVLSVIAILGMLSNLIIRLIISNYGSISQVGVFEAGVVVVTSYLGIVMGALNTDYYPKMFAAINSNNDLEINLNSQLNAALLMLTPLLCVFIFLMHFIIEFLYTASFIETIDYLKFAIFAVLINICSDTLGVVLIAKNNKRIIISTAILFRILLVLFSFYGFLWYGIYGLGLAFLIVSIINLCITMVIVYNKHKLFYSNKTLLNALSLFLFVMISMLLFHFENVFIKVFLEALLLSVLIVYSNKKIKLVMGVDLSSLLKSKLIRK